MFGVPLEKASHNGLRCRDPPQVQDRVGPRFYERIQCVRNKTKQNILSNH